MSTEPGTAQADVWAWIEWAWAFMDANGLDYLSSSMGNASQTPLYAAPDLVKVNGWFTVEFMDQHRNITTFRLLDALFERRSKAKQRRDGAYATYLIVGWDEQFSSPQDYVLVWVNSIEIRSRLQGPGPFYFINESMFKQIGRVRGSFVQLP